MFVVEAAVAKTPKYAVPESGDTVELVERPRGGISLVLADGQRSGLPAKVISNLVARKAATLLAEGVRDGAAARAASDYLLALRRGQVSSDLIILSTDLETRTLVITRNTGCPVLFGRNGEMSVVAEESGALGTSRITRPQITEVPLEPGLTAVAFSDGVWEAGTLSQRPQGIPPWMSSLLSRHHGDAAPLADAILAEAVALDHGRPRDDMAVVVLATGRYEEPIDVRRMHVVFPVC